MTADGTIGVGIIGGSGYGAGELLRLLARHPAARVVSVVSQSRAGQALAALHPQLAGFYALTVADRLDLQALSAFPRAVVFSALPHGASAKTIASLIASELPANACLIDLSGDHRLSDPAVHAECYPESPVSPGVRAQFRYGLPELGSTAIARARFIANPGCYATACILAVAPLIGFCRAAVFFDAKSGSSGAGRALSADTHHPALHASMQAYKVFKHRHEPEIQQELGADLPCSFVPQLIPVSRGIYVTAHLELQKEIELDALRARYFQYYRAARFIRLREEPPSLQAVVGSNFCDLSIASRGRRVAVMAAIDNLVKGMAGQAIQNMNLMCGLPEETGLDFPAPGLI